ncbi:gliding motility-associated C-terminal domain-containing protein, partial [Flavobacterium caeni]
GITGTWNPSAINNTASGSYVFTPNAGQCATPVTLNVTVSSSIIPDFATALSLCTGTTAPVLNTTSPNGITGTWNPSVISNTASGSYVFMPNFGQCATPVTLNVTVSEIVFTVNQYCLGTDFHLEAVGINTGGLDFTWLWDGQVVGNEALLNVSRLLDGSETYPLTFQVSVTQPGGCTVTENAVVYGTFCTIPKGISPNGDQQNDAFDLTGMGVTQLQIFNRYGTKVFGKRNYTNEWQGQSDNGNELPDATYYYVIETSMGETKTGWVYLNR